MLSTTDVGIMRHVPFPERKAHQKTMAFPKEVILYINIVLVLTGAIFAFLATEVYAFVPTASPSQTFATRTKSYLNTTPVESFPRTRSVIRRRTRATPTIEAVAPEAVFASVNPMIERTGHASGVDVDGTQLPPWTPPLLLSEGLLDDPTKVALFALGGLAVAAAGFQTAVYWRMQYVVRTDDSGIRLTTLTVVFATFKNFSGNARTTHCTQTTITPQKMIRKQLEETGNLS